MDNENAVVKKSQPSVISIGAVSVPVLEYHGNRVVTFVTVDQVHQRPEGTAARNFQYNRKRFIEGTDYYFINYAQKDEFRAMGIEISPRGLILLTQSGYFMLVKSLTDNMAWQIQKELINRYFYNHLPTKATQILQISQLMVEHEERMEQVEARQALQHAQIEYIAARQAIIEEKLLDQLPRSELMGLEEEEAADWVEPEPVAEQDKPKSPPTEAVAPVVPETWMAQVALNAPVAAEIKEWSESPEPVADFEATIPPPKTWMTKVAPPNAPSTVQTSELPTTVAEEVVPVAPTTWMIKVAPPSATVPDQASELPVTVSEDIAPETWMTQLVSNAPAAEEIKASEPPRQPKGTTQLATDAAKTRMPDDTTGEILAGAASPSVHQETRTLTSASTSPAPTARRHWVPVLAGMILVLVTVDLGYRYFVVPQESPAPVAARLPVKETRPPTTASQEDTEKQRQLLLLQTELKHQEAANRAMAEEHHAALMQLEARLEARLDADKKQQLAAEVSKQHQLEAEHRRVIADYQKQLALLVAEKKTKPIETAPEERLQPVKEMAHTPNKTGLAPPVLELSRQDETPKTVPTQVKALTNATNRDAVTGMELVWVPGGIFEMGCGSKDADCRSDELPVHSVNLDGFWMGKSEVTQGQWQAVMGNYTPGYEDCGVDCPVVGVSWSEVLEFVKKLNARGEGGFRLPTEAEWEYACRSAGKPEKYAGGDKLDQVAWYADNSQSMMHHVMTKAANGLGLYDMSGNVWEWVQDVKTPYRPEALSNPIHDSGGGVERVARGGSWGGGVRFERCAVRSSYPTYHRNSFLGVRLVKKL